MDIYYIDGNFVSGDDAVIPAGDLIVLRGYGVFDYLVTYNKRPFHLDAHARRLEKSAEQIGLPLAHSRADICAIVEETLHRNAHHVESSIRIVYTGGISEDGLTPEGNGKLMVMVTARPEMPAEWYQKGAKVITLELDRFLPGTKSTNYLSAVWAIGKARRQGAAEAIYIDRQQRLFEGTTSNFYCFDHNRLITPDVDVLPGITRNVILDLAKNEFDVELRPIEMAEVATMRDVFISSSNKEIVPVVQINDTVIGDGRPGAGTRRVMQLFREYTTAYGQGRI